MNTYYNRTLSTTLESLLIKGIIPWLVISASNNNSTAKARFNEVMNYAKRMFGQNFLATLEKKIYFPPDILINW